MFEISITYIIITIIIYIILVIIFLNNISLKSKLYIEERVKYLHKRIVKIKNLEKVLGYINKYIIKTTEVVMKYNFKGIRKISDKIMQMEENYIKEIGPIITEGGNISSLLIRKLYNVGKKYIILILYSYLLIIYIILSLS